MKKLILMMGLLGLMSGGLQLAAAPVTADRALGLAERVLPAAKTRAAAEPLKVIWDGEVAATPEAPALYVIGRESGGFVIIAGDDRVYPVLAISDSEVFRVEGMPANVRWWMERMKAYVRSVGTPEAGAVAAWSAKTRAKEDASLPEGQVTGKVEKLTPTWDQGNNDNYYFGQEVFNAKCPANGGSHYVTGCVPLALGEVLTYLSGQTGVEMPSAAHGTVEAYDPGNGYAPSFPYVLGTTYDWEGLRTLTSIQAVRSACQAGNTALLDNLAQLLADLGAIVHASYNTSQYGGTSASISIPRLIEHLDLNKRARNEYESSYTARQWVAMLKAEIDLRPVLYGGRSVAPAGQYTDGSPYYAGHQFIFDGYGKYGDEDVFHVNFGWGGSCNGYYRYYRLDTDLNAGGRYDYSRGCDAVFGFYPDVNSTFQTSLMFMQAAEAAKYFSEKPGFETDKTVAAKTYFTLYLRGIQNRGMATYANAIRVFREDKDGVSDASHICGINVNFNSGQFYPNIHWTNLYLNENQVKFGSRLVAKYASDEAPGGWATVSCVEDGTTLPDLPLMPVPFIRTESGYAVGDYFTFRVKNILTPYAGTVWTVTAPDGVKTVYQQADREFCLTQRGKYKIDAAIATEAGGTVTEHVVAVINVQ